MLFRIMCVSADGKEAFAERVESATIYSADGRCIIHSMDGGVYMGRESDLIKDPEIIKKCSAEWLYKIKVEG